MSITDSPVKYELEIRRTAGIMIVATVAIAVAILLQYLILVMYIQVLSLIHGESGSKKEVHFSSERHAELLGTRHTRASRLRSQESRQYGSLIHSIVSFSRFVVPV